MIIPTNYAGFDIVQYLACVVMLGFGTWLGAFMAKLEDTINNISNSFASQGCFFVTQINHIC